MQAWHGSILVILAATSVSSAQVGSISPAEERIQASEKAIQSNPQRYQAYNDLAFALVSRGRETADAKYYRQAAEAVETSLLLAPDNFEALTAQVEVLNEAIFFEFGQSWQNDLAIVITGYGQDSQRGACLLPSLEPRS